MEPLDPARSLTPPSDPEQWTDEQWLTWLKTTDAEAEAERGAPPATAAGRLTHTRGAQALGQTMLGMAWAIYGRRDDEVAIVVQANSRPEEDQPLVVHLDSDHPERSYVVVKPAPGTPS
jgi:hypothetical protein